MMDEFFFPYFFRWVDSLKRQGIPSVWHTDGNISILMDRVLESGVNAIQCVDPLAGMDIVALKKQVEGRLTLIGNMDCSVLQSGPAEAIRDQCRYILEGCRGSGGFVFSACNVIFRGIPLENYEVMVQARQEFGREG